MIKPNKLISEYLDNLNPKEVLDLGCGKGRVSLRFAKKGAKVFGVDKKAKKINQENFKFINQDIRNLEINKKYDLITISLVLHYLEKSKALEIIRKTKNNTKKGGYNFIACLSEKDNLYNKVNFFPDLEEIKKLYSDWQILKSTQDYTPIEKHDNLKPHKHNIVFMLAKKP